MPLRKVIPKPLTNAVWDHIYEAWVVPTTCACCEKCALYVSGKHFGRCIHWGPYHGYVTMQDDLRDE